MFMYAQHILLYLRSKLLSAGAEEDGQGTTEYALLVGLLVVVAIVAVIAISPIVEGLWSDISENMKQVDTVR